MNAAVWFLSRITLFIMPIPALSLGLFEWYYHQATLIHAAYLGPTSPKVSAYHHVGNALLRGWNPFIAQAGPLLVEAFTMKGTVLDELGNLWDKIIVRYSPVRTSPQILVCRSRPRTHVPGVACSINTLNACISVTLTSGDRNRGANGSGLRCNRGYTIFILKLSWIAIHCP